MHAFSKPIAAFGDSAPTRCRTKAPRCMQSWHRHPSAAAHSLSSTPCLCMQRKAAHLDAGRDDSSLLQACVTLPSRHASVHPCCTQNISQLCLGQSSLSVLIWCLWSQRHSLFECKAPTQLPAGSAPVNPLPGKGYAAAQTVAGVSISAERQAFPRQGAPADNCAKSGPTSEIMHGAMLRK